MRGFVLLTVLVLGGCGATEGPAHARYTATGELIALSGGDGGAEMACSTCHGLDGQGDGALTPRLSGLPEGYLIKQMEDYGTGYRRDDVMRPAVRWLTDSDRQAVASYYASMPTSGSAAGRQETAGAELYRRGGATSCAACHGPNGEGLGPANPPLAGQPAAYLIEQLERWRRGDRRNDPRDVMLEAVRDLSDEDIEQLTDWLAAQPFSSGGSSTGNIPGNTSSRSIR